MNKSVIIVAGGKGVRMNSEIPKQFIEICGKPLLMHTIEQFYSFSSEIKIILVLPSEQINFWNNLCHIYFFSIPHSIVEGGKERFYSVKNGLEKMETEFVAIHDGVRPLVSFDTLKRCFEGVETNDGIIPVVDLIDSVRFAENFENSKPVDRNCYKLVQTPQVFRSEI